MSKIQCIYSLPLPKNQSINSHHKQTSNKITHVADINICSTNWHISFQEFLQNQHNAAPMERNIEYHTLCPFHIQFSTQNCYIRLDETHSIPQSLWVECYLPKRSEIALHRQIEKKHSYHFLCQSDVRSSDSPPHFRSVNYKMSLHLAWTSIVCGLSD